MRQTQAPIRKIELRPAYVWDCPNCGLEMFVRGIVPEMSLEENDELRNSHGVEPWETGDFVLMPENVECLGCHSHFATIHFSESECDEEE